MLGGELGYEPPHKRKMLSALSKPGAFVGHKAMQSRSSFRDAGLEEKSVVSGSGAQLNFSFRELLSGVLLSKETHAQESLNQSQKMTAAAMHMLEKKVWAQLSYLV